MIICLSMGQTFHDSPYESFSKDMLLNWSIFTILSGFTQGFQVTRWCWIHEVHIFIFIIHVINQLIQVNEPGIRGLKISKKFVLVLCKFWCEFLLFISEKSIFCLSIARAILPFYPSWWYVNLILNGNFIKNSSQLGFKLIFFYCWQILIRFWVVKVVKGKKN